MADSFLLFDHQVKEHISEKLLPFFKETILPFALAEDKIPEFPPESRVYAYITDQQAVSVIEAAIKNDWHLSLLPHPNALFLQRGYCIERNLEIAISDAQQAQPRNVDIIRCNGEMILSSVIIGQAFHLSPDVKSTTWREQLKKNWENIRHIQQLTPQKLSFTTERDANFNTAALGVVVFQQGYQSSMLRNILPESHINDGMFHTMIIAPRSIMGMLKFFIASPFSVVKKRPSFIGLLKTKFITVCSSDAIFYTIDGNEQSAPEIKIETEHRVLKLLVDESFPITDSAESSKEERKITQLPVGEAAQEMASNPLPFIAHAATEEFKELYQLLRENATTSPVFLTLMVLSTLLASIGLYANSAPVIIGAMILAPLMAPIISLSMGLTRQDTPLFSDSLKTLLTGSVTALVFAAVASFILPMEVITPEIANRLSPNLLDLGVAVLSGIAGAYAHARAGVAKSMAGVAIAVALVPPLAVSGIGLGWLNIEVTWGALLLFLTNLAGIILAASLTFLALGFSPFKRAKKGLTIALISVLLVSIPLVISFNRLSDEAQIVQSLQGLQVDNIVIREISAQSHDPIELSLQLLTPTSLNDAQLDQIKEAIEHKLQRKVLMEAQVIIRR